MNGTSRSTIVARTRPANGGRSGTCHALFQPSDHPGLWILALGAVIRRLRRSENRGKLHHRVLLGLLDTRRSHEQHVPLRH
jgi:hypothetical protein